MRPALLRGLRIAAAVLLLDILLTLDIIWPTPWVTWFGALSVELGVLLLSLGLLQSVAPRVLPRLAWPLALFLLPLVLGRYGDVAAHSLYGRPINLYWDVPHLANVGGMFAGAAPAWQIAAALAIVVAVLAGIAWGLARATRELLRAQAVPAARAALMGVGALLVAGYALVGGREEPVRFVEYGRPVIGTYVAQWQRVRDSAGSTRAARALAPSPAWPGPPVLLGGADVVLVFMESYGASTYDLPRYRDGLRDARAAFAAAAAETGSEVRSAFVRSPTFSGGSWLAHLSLLSGVEVTDPDLYSLLMTQQRRTLVHAFREAGYRAAAVMPGMRLAWPEGGFYGFDTIHDAAAMQWRGPEFGWWHIPDQFTFARLMDLELDRPAPRPPVFAVLATVSTHLPFEPVPPLQPDWQRLRGPRPYAPDVLARALAREPDWLDLGRSYVDAVDYALRGLAGLMRERPDAQRVLVIVGDHQPAANVSGNDASWDVPVHVVTGNRAILDALEANGFSPGLDPPRPTLARLHELGPLLLRSFASPPEPAAPPVSQAR
jgi:hypothetical protein